MHSVPLVKGRKEVFAKIFKNDILTSNTNIKEIYYENKKNTFEFAYLVGKRYDTCLRRKD